MVPIKYEPNFIANPTELFENLKALDWERRGDTPRCEYYINKLGNIPYMYGRGLGQREYFPRPCPSSIDAVFESLKIHASFDVCFLNRYLNQSDHLGWHADNSPEMDDNRPIAIISLGVEREIWFCPKDDKSSPLKVKLGHGSLCLMEKGMQDTHLHRIPKASMLCGERISLTFRGYIKN